VRALLVPVGADWYAVAMTEVRGVVAAPTLIGVPTGPSSLLGLFNLRGEILPMFDAAVLLGVGRADATQFAIVVQTNLGLAGLVATGFPESVELGGSIDADVVSGKAAYAVGTRVVTLVDIDDLLSPARITAGRR
jgi:purine-binding chemotaxis protein CheW